MNAVTRIHSRSVVLADDNIDTDRIIPARFLTTTTRAGLGRHCFNDWRYLADGSDNPDFALNQPQARGCSILVAGRNFGCGSSREHAPWALLDYGIAVVISSEIADIFRNNALGNGLLAIEVAAAEQRWLLAHGGIELTIDVAGQYIALPDGGRIGFELEPFARHCLLHGVDAFGYLLQQQAAIAAWEAGHGVAA
ncbi:MAG: 3-isopropylmalate dehydratase small subunit [Dokdonella sp.]|nr:3-isopropylmalate dehydratase small subunit [Dokdonella sp.]